MIVAHYAPLDVGCKIEDDIFIYSGGMGGFTAQEMAFMFARMMYHISQLAGECADEGGVSRKEMASDIARFMKGVEKSYKLRKKENTDASPTDDEEGPA